MRLLNAVVITSLVSLFSFDVLVGEEALANGKSETSQGANPQGRPFKEIFKSLESLGSRLDSAFTRIALVEDSFSGISGEIESLKNENSALIEQISLVEQGLLSIEEIIAALKSQTTDLEEQIANNSEIAAELEMQIASNATLIVTLELYTESEIAGLEQRLMQNQELIAQLSEAQQSLQAQLELKQEVLDGSCPDDQRLVGINDQGLVCETVSPLGQVSVIQRTRTVELQVYNGGANGGLCGFNPSSNRWVPYSFRGQLNSLSCPTGSHVVGAGTVSTPDYFISDAGTTIRHSWRDYTFDAATISLRVNDWLIKNPITNGVMKNPLWEPYERSPVECNGAPAAESLFVKQYIQCLGLTESGPIPEE